MIASVDRFLGRRYGAGYDCLDFACEVWLAHCGQNLRPLLKDALGANRRLTVGVLRPFAQLEVPCDPCLVLLRQERLVPHVGVYLRSRVLHLTAVRVEFQPLDIVMRGFKSCHFYLPRADDADRLSL